EQEVGFAIDVVGGDSARRGDEQDDLATAHPLLQLAAAYLEEIRHAALQDGRVGRIGLGALEDDESAGALDPADGLVNGELARRTAPAVVDVRDTRVVVDIIRPAGRRVARQLDQPRQLEKGMARQLVIQCEMTAVEVLPKGLGFQVEHDSSYMLSADRAAVVSVKGGCGHMTCFSNARERPLRVGWHRSARGAIPSSP